MNKQDFGHSWRNIDAPGDPGYFVRFMDVINSMDWFRSHKRRCIDLMEIKAGDQVLEVGCGTGEEARVMGQLVGPAGRVTAIDYSQTMVTEAQQRTQDTGLPLEFKTGDARQLEFADNSFDSVGSFNVFEIVPDPEQALAEIVRVTRPGGRIVVPGPDSDTTVVNSPDRALTRRILNHFADNSVNGTIGRRLPSMFRRHGLVDVAIEPHARVFQDYERIRELWLDSIASSALRAGVVTAAEAEKWLEDLAEVSRTDGFIFGGLSFVVSGRKP